MALIDDINQFIDSCIRYKENDDQAYLIYKKYTDITDMILDKKKTQVQRIVDAQIAEISQQLKIIQADAHEVTTLLNKVSSTKNDIIYALDEDLPIIIEKMWYRLVRASISLENLLAARYRTRFEYSTKHEKPKYVKMAMEHIQHAISCFNVEKNRLLQINKQQPEEMDARLHELTADITLLYQCYHIHKDDPAYQLLIQARATTNKDQAFTIFQQAIDLFQSRDNKVLMFSIFVEQGLLYGTAVNTIKNNLIGEDAVKLEYDYIKKPMFAYLSAVELFPNVKELNAPLANRQSILISHDLKIVAQYLYQLSNHTKISNQLDLRSELLVFAFKLLLNGKKILIKDNPYINEYEDTIKTVFQKLAEVKENIKKREEKLKQKQIYAKLLEEITEDYNRKFLEILSTFQPEALTVDNKPKHDNESNNNNEDGHAHDDQTNHTTSGNEIIYNNQIDNKNIYCLFNNVTDDNKLIPNYIDTHLNISKFSSNKKITSQELEMLLLKAKENNDTLEQLRIKMNIAEHHRINARLHLNRPSAITSLKQAKESLLDTPNLFQQVKSSNNDESIEQKCIDMKISIDKILTGIDTTTNEAISLNGKADKQLQAAKESTKAFLIDKYGEDRWKKEGIWAHLKNKVSVHTKMRRQARENLNQLNEIKNSIKNISVQFNQDHTKHSRKKLPFKGNGQFEKHVIPYSQHQTPKLENRRKI